MKILVGICGIGNGHLSRQTNVINLLLANSYEILVATTHNNIKYFKEKFSNIKILEINIPWIECNVNGIDFELSLRKYNDSNIDLFKSFLEFSKNIEKVFNGIPDVVVTDYEPNVAQYSYAVDIPLICMEQQSKFLYLDEIKIKKYSILEEKKRINYFFPKYDYKIISSFFPIKINDKKVKIITPIISKLEKKEIKKNHILVYFSPYEYSKNYINILKVLNEIDNFNIIVYTKENFNKEDFNNIIFKNYSNNFRDDLEDAYCLISTAGHQLLSESISIDIPSYLIPLDTYEQNYNAKMIDKYKLGFISEEISKEEICKFIKNVPFYKNKIAIFKTKYYKKSWEKEILKIIELYK